MNGDVKNNGLAKCNPISWKNKRTFGVSLNSSPRSKFNPWSNVIALTENGNLRREIIKRKS